MEYEAQEIDEAGLKEGEEEELGERIRRLRSAQRIQESCENAVSFLRGGQDGYGGGIGALNDALAQMQWIEEPGFSNIVFYRFYIIGCSRHR